MRGLRALWLSSTIAAASLALPSRVATAFTLRVLAASELRIEPRLAADRSTLTLTVKLRDDRGAPLRNRTVRLDAPVDGTSRTITLTTGANGEAEHVVPLSRTQSRVEASAQYDGDGSTAPQRASISVNLDAPYVTVDVVPPATAIELSARAAPFVVVLRVGEVVSFPARDQGVELREGARLLASGVTDASGRAPLSVDGSAFATASVVASRATDTGADGRGAPEAVVSSPWSVAPAPSSSPSRRSIVRLVCVCTSTSWSGPSTRSPRTSVMARTRWTHAVAKADPSTDNGARPDASVTP